MSAGLVYAAADSEFICLSAPLCLEKDVCLESSPLALTVFMWSLLHRSLSLEGCDTLVDLSVDSDLWL